MSLPFKVISVEAPQLQEVKGNNIDAPYLYTLKRLPLMQLTRVLDQLTELSAFSNHLFADLGNKTIQLQQRFKNIETRVGSIAAGMEQGFAKIEKGGQESISRTSIFNIYKGNRIKAQWYSKTIYSLLDQGLFS